MNLVVTTGRLVQEPDLMETQTTGQRYVRFTLASNFLFGEKAEQATKDGQPTADFYNCTAWGDYMANLLSGMSKGDLVLVVGDKTTHNYDTKDGGKGISQNINVSKVERLTFKEEKAPWDR